MNIISHRNISYAISVTAFFHCWVSEKQSGGGRIRSEGQILPERVSAVIMYITVLFNMPTFSFQWLVWALRCVNDPHALNWWHVPTLLLRKSCDSAVACLKSSHSHPGTAAAVVHDVPQGHLNKNTTCPWRVYVCSSQNRIFIKSDPMWFTPAFIVSADQLHVVIISYQFVVL